MGGSHRLGHKHGDRDGWRRANFLNERHEAARIYLQSPVAHFVAGIARELGQVIRFSLRLSLRHLEIWTHLAGNREGIELLRLGHGARVGTNPARVVLLAVTHTVVVVEHRLDERIDALAVAEAVVHGKTRNVAVAGEVKHMVVGLVTAHVAQLLPSANLHGKRVGGIVHGAVLDLEGVGEVGHARDRAVQGLLQEVGIHFVFVRYLDCIDRDVYRKVHIR